MSILFGALVDDPGIQQGQGVLPQFVYVAFAMGGLLPAGIFIRTRSRIWPVAPGVTMVSYPVGVLVALVAVTFIPMFLFPVWMIIVVITHTRLRRMAT